MKAVILGTNPSFDKSKLAKVGIRKVTDLESCKSTGDLLRDIRGADRVIILNYQLGILEIMALGIYLGKYGGRKGSFRVIAPEEVAVGYEFLRDFTRPIATVRLYKELEDIVVHVKSK